jgi:hypothetical protein
MQEFLARLDGVPAGDGAIRYCDEPGELLLKLAKKALANPPARTLFTNSIISLGEAEVILKLHGTTIVERVRRGEIYGVLTANYDWFFTRNAVNRLRHMNNIRQWLAPSALEDFEEPL